MLKIRPEQFAVFQKTALQEFEDFMVIHLSKFFQARVAELGEPNVRDLIRYGVQRAASYRISLQPDVCKYIGIMVVFGRDFDRDPKLAWASTILADPNFPSSSVRVDELHKAAVASVSIKETDDGGPRPS